MIPLFKIAFTDDCWSDEGIPFRGLQLTLEDYTEEEQADLAFWSTEDYEAHWLTELNRVTTSRHKGALITSIHDPANAFRVWVWTMWKEGNRVLFQNRLLFMLEECQAFNPDQVSDHIGEYASHTEEGSRISEWIVPIAAIRNFLGERISH